MADLDAALQQFEATEANLEKLEKLWAQIESHIPDGPAFGNPPEYDELCLAFRQILQFLPAIDGFRVGDELHEYNAIGQMRLDALEIDEIEAKISVENYVNEQGRILREYRFKLHSKRRELIRDRMVGLIDDVDELLRQLSAVTEGKEISEHVSTFSEVQHTHAPDRGRDLSVITVENDPLAGVRRYRVIIQCKHWLTKSVGASDVNSVRGQMELWQPPRVDRLIIATSGRFSADAIALVEQHNLADRALHIGMWPDSHLELLLAARPHLIGQFGLKRVR
jgi:hypothetical protein